ncbi:hypothetical protein K438DRAFT_1777892 [Mycena galopus ATCC 62051]|nr:hypothetical protein K438DRAFT_1777892 [Mycena galopus ATCC 62051]
MVSADRPCLIGCDDLRRLGVQWYESREFGSRDRESSRSDQRFQIWDPSQRRLKNRTMQGPSRITGEKAMRGHVKEGSRERGVLASGGRNNLRSMYLALDWSPPRQIQSKWAVGHATDQPHLDEAPSKTDGSSVRNMKFSLASESTVGVVTDLVICEAEKRGAPGNGKARLGQKRRTVADDNTEEEAGVHGHEVNNNTREGREFGGMREPTKLSIHWPFSMLFSILKSRQIDSLASKLSRPSQFSMLFSILKSRQIDSLASKTVQICDLDVNMTL